MSGVRRTETKIWIAIDKFNDGTSGGSAAVKDVHVTSDFTPQDIITAIRERFKIKEPDLAFKLRNHRGSLILINSKLRSNSKSVPYVLEVSNFHQTVEATPPATEMSDHQLALKKTLCSFDERISKLEKEVPNLKNNRSKRITQEMEEIEKTLLFLNSRLDESQKPKWQGMFKKNPFW